MGVRAFRTAAAGVVALLLSGCGDSPTQPPDPVPRLSNFSYTLEGLNLESCPPAGLENSSLFRWTVDYADADGDIEPPFRMIWATVFNPSGNAKLALFPINADAIQGDRFGGTISLRQCIRFVTEESVDITVSIQDAADNRSEDITLRIERPTGALSPPAADANVPGGSLDRPIEPEGLPVP